MGLVLSSGPAVFALLDWPAFGRDQFELSVMVVTVAHAVTSDARLARPLLSVPKHDGRWLAGRRETADVLCFALVGGRVYTRLCQAGRASYTVLLPAQALVAIQFQKDGPAGLYEVFSRAPRLTRSEDEKRLKATTAERR